MGRARRHGADHWTQQGVRVQRQGCNRPGRAIPHTAPRRPLQPEYPQGHGTRHRSLASKGRNDKRPVQDVQRRRGRRRDRARRDEWRCLHRPCVRHCGAATLHAAHHVAAVLPCRHLGCVERTLRAIAGAECARWSRCRGESGFSARRRAGRRRSRSRRSTTLAFAAVCCAHLHRHRRAPVCVNRRQGRAVERRRTLPPRARTRRPDKLAYRRLHQRLDRRHV
jgi:hypothetical protein